MKNIFTNLASRVRAFLENPSKKRLKKDKYEAIVALRKEGKTLKEIGDTFGITRERVRQIVLQYAPEVVAEIRATMAPTFPCRCCGKPVYANQKRVTCSRECHAKLYPPPPKEEQVKRDSVRFKERYQTEPLLREKVIAATKAWKEKKLREEPTYADTLRERSKNYQRKRAEKIKADPITYQHVLQRRKERSQKNYALHKERMLDPDYAKTFKEAEKRRRDTYLARKKERHASRIAELRKRFGIDPLTNVNRGI